MNAKQKDGKKRWEKAKWKAFVNVNLSQLEKAEVKDNLLAEVTGYEFLMNAATDGYKCSISYSIPEDVYTVSLTGMWKSRPNAGLTMSMRHRDLIVAITGLAWCQASTGIDGSWEERFGSAGDDDW